MDVDDDEIGTAPDGRILVREKRNKKIDEDMLSSDEDEGIPENIRMSDQKVNIFYNNICLRRRFSVGDFRTKFAYKICEHSSFFNY